MDQKFMDPVPGCAGGARILQDTAYNVAYWNHKPRTLGGEPGDGLLTGATAVLSFQRHRSDRSPALAQAHRGILRRGCLRVGTSARTTKCFVEKKRADTERYAGPGERRFEG